MTLGFMFDIIRVIKASTSNPYRLFMNPLLEQYYGDDVPDVVLFWLMGVPCAVFNKVKYLDDIYVKKNALTTKHKINRENSKPFLFSNIVGMDSADPHYKMRRKTLSSAFFKDRIRTIVDGVKVTCMRLFKEVQDQGDKVELDLVDFTTKV